MWVVRRVVRGVVRWVVRGVGQWVARGAGISLFNSPNSQFLQFIDAILRGTLHFKFESSSSLQKVCNCSTLFHELGYCETQDCGQLTICKTVTINLFESSLSIIFQTLQHLSRTASAERRKCLHVNKLVPTVSTLSALLSGNHSENFSAICLRHSVFF